MTTENTPTIDLDALEATAKAASQGLWEAEWCDERLELNKGTALTDWNDDRTVGSPSSSWRTIDRLIELDVEDMSDAEATEAAANLDHIAAARPEIVLALIERLRAAEARGSVTTEAAHAEAHRRYDGDTIISDVTDEPVSHDDWGYAECERQAFVAGVEWASKGEQS